MKIYAVLTVARQIEGEWQVIRSEKAFIDADKAQYEAYYEGCLLLVRQGGLIVIDNVLWEGAVVDPEDQEPATVAIRCFNEKLHSDTRIKLSMVPIGDGLSLALKMA